MNSTYSQPVDSELHDSLITIRAFQQVCGDLASSGFVRDYEFSFVKQSGFQHIISLLPGNQNREKSTVESLGMSFTNIAVDWSKPTLKNLEAYFKEMNSRKGKKILTHCEANMRASAFLFLYRVTQQEVDKKIARAAMDSIWYPTDTWHAFIGNALEAYGLDPEYRYEPEFVELLRREGILAAEKELTRILAEGETIPFNEKDLSRVAEEFASAKNTDDAILVYTMNTLAFPDSWRTHNQLGNILMKTGDNEAAMLSYSRVIELNEDFIWAKRMLGKSGSPEFDIFWTGTEIQPDIISPLAGTYDMGSGSFEFIAEKNRFYLQTSWSRKKFELYSDSPDTYFIHENDWIFEFPNGKSKKVLFIRPGITLTGEAK